MTKDFKNVVVVNWASTSLAFIDYIRQETEKNRCALDLIKISHHPSWFTSEKSIFCNLLHLAKQFFPVLKKRFSSDSTFVFFGTNLNRVFFVFFMNSKNTFYIYNEMPSLNKKSISYYLDKFIFNKFDNVFVSNVERASYLKQAYNLKALPRIIENCSFLEYENLDVSSLSNRNSAVFIGSVSEKRFGNEMFPKFKKLSNILNCQIDIYSLNEFKDLSSFNKYINLNKPVEHREVFKVLNNYKYGILSYYTGEINYDLCAPLKLFEYISCGCILISMCKNKSLLNFAERYPNLIFFIDDICEINDLHVDYGLYISERNHYLSYGVNNNKEFANEVISA